MVTAKGRSIRMNGRAGQVRGRAWARKLLVAVIVAALGWVGLPVLAADATGLPPTEIVGIVRDSQTHAPLAGIEVRARERDGISLPAGPWTTVTTAGDGSYVLPLAWQCFELVYTDPTGVRATFTSDAYCLQAPGHRSVRDVDLDLSASISGTVVDEVTGAPVEGVCIVASPALDTSSRNRPGPECTDVAGHYSFERLVASSYVVEIDPWSQGNPLYRPESFSGELPDSDARIVTVAPGQHATVNA